MKNLKYISAIILLFTVLWSCDKQDIDVDALTDFAPGVVSISPSDGGKVVQGDFNLNIVFADGTNSPLSSGTLTLTDEGGNQLVSISETLTGVRDSLYVEGSSFNAATLALGVYNMTFTATDAGGQTTSQNTTFEISSLPFAANHDVMFISGTFNGWAPTPLTLVADHTWQALEVEMDGGEWKLRNTDDWSDEAWGDPDCDNTMQDGSGFNPGVTCDITGTVNVTFNDQTLQYTVAPSVIFEQNVESLYLLGSFNDFQGNVDSKFIQTADNIWEIAEFELNPGDLFKFSEGPNFEGTNYGDDEGDGIAEEFGATISFAEPEGNAFYKITFNDQTLEYDFEFVRFPSIGIIGDATPTGWASDTDLTDFGDGTFRIVIPLVGGAAVKFRANDAWATNWGGDVFPTGTATLGGDNIAVPESGTYLIVFNPSTGEVSFTKTLIEIIGDATPGGWAEGTDMVEDPANPGVFTLTLALEALNAKFRIDGSWDFNWGSAAFPTGTGNPGGDNIPVGTAGTYDITFNVFTGEYSFQ